MSLPSTHFLDINAAISALPQPLPNANLPYLASPITSGFYVFVAQLELFVFDQVDASSLPYKLGPTASPHAASGDGDHGRLSSLRYRPFVFLHATVSIGAAEKGTWVRIFQPPAEGKLVHGWEGLEVGDKLRVKLISTDVERGFIDFVRTG